MSYTSSQVSGAFANSDRAAGSLMSEHVVEYF